MFDQESLTTEAIKDLFTREISAAGGEVSDTFDDGSCLFTRSVLPQVREVQRTDKVQGGVALRASEQEVWVNPYVFRLICRNGAIRAHALETRHFEFAECGTTEEAAGALRDAIQACCSPEVFKAGVDEMRSARGAEVDLVLELLPLLSHFPPSRQASLLRIITDRFFQETDRSRFGLLNSVTSLARDSRDPELRWRLEELGGGIAAHREPAPWTDDSMAETLLSSACPISREVGRGQRSRRRGA
jgi:hypothetical protein